MNLPVCIAMTVVLLVSVAGCKEKAVENRVDLDQIQVDNSNDYRYIFREEIRKEEERRNKDKKRVFR